MPAERPRLVAQALLQLFALNQVSAWVPLGRPSRTFHAKATDAWNTEVTWESTYTAWVEEGADSGAASGLAKGESVELLLQHTSAESVYLADAKLGVADSHELVDFAASGRPMVRVGHAERFVYVDEHACIGCTHCAGAAPSTFFMEEGHGRARVYQQQGDASGVIQDAIEMCPVSCIHYVPFEKLKSLEERRQTQKINPRSRRGDMAGEAPRDDVPLWTEQLWPVDAEKLAKAKADPLNPNRWDDIEATASVRRERGLGDDLGGSERARPLGERPDATEQARASPSSPAPRRRVDL